MAEYIPGDVRPDRTLLCQIFPYVHPEAWTTCILVQTEDKCVFGAYFQGFNRFIRENLVIVRVETLSEQNLKSFAAVAALQGIAAKVLPDLVPETQRIGEATNEDGKEFRYSVVFYIEGDTLDDVWEGMSPDNQRSVVIEIAEAMKKLHSVRPGDTWAEDLMLPAVETTSVKSFNEFEQPIVYGGPRTGFLGDGITLLHAVVESYQFGDPIVRIDSVPGCEDAEIKTIYKDIEPLAISEADMHEWPREAVLCHNDLTPRNIIVRATKSQSSAAGPTYELAGIIDWEMAGFYPASYELLKQDTHFCLVNRHVSFYLLLKKHLGALVPRNSSQISLLKAMDLVYRTQQRSLAELGNIGANMRKRFLEALNLVRDPDPYIGWAIEGRARGETGTFQ